MSGPLEDIPFEGVEGSPAPGGRATSAFSRFRTESWRRPRLGRGRYFAAVFLSFYGDWLTTIALVVVLYQLTGTPAGPAGYMVARIAPRMIGPWLGGALADRHSARAVMASAMALQAVSTAALIPAHRSGTLWAVYAAVAVAQFLGALGRPSQGAILPTLVSPAGLGRANALYSTLFSSSIFVGPALGAVLLPRTGADLLFAIDAATFAVGSVLAMTLPRRSAPGGRRKSFLSDLAGGIGPALREPTIRIVAAGNFATGLVITVTQAVLVAAAQDRFGGSSAVGFLYSSVGIGGAVGGVLALRWSPPRRSVRLAVMVGAVVEVTGLMGFGWVGAVPAAVVLLATSAAGGSAFDAWGNTEVQRRAPVDMIGRYNAVIFIALFSGMLVGAVWVVAVAERVAWSHALTLAGVAMLVLLGAVWATSREEQVELLGSAADPVAQSREAETAAN